MYLSTVYFEQGFYGLPAAARGYFANGSLSASQADAAFAAPLGLIAQ